MPFVSILIIALSLAMDAFAVSLSLGASGSRNAWRRALVTGGVFGTFQAFMPVLGWLLGAAAYRFIAAFDYWLAFGLLFFTGGHMIFQAIQPDDEVPLDVGWSGLLSMGVATSIDAFAIGISLSILKVPMVLPVVTIGIVTFLLSVAGVYIGGRAVRWSEKGIVVAGGWLLIGLGIKLLVERLVGNDALFDIGYAVGFAFLLTLAAGMATGIGSLLALFMKRTGLRRFSLLLGGSTGLMLWIAFREMLPAVEGLALAPSLSGLCFVSGFVLAAAIDYLVPDFGNPHEPQMIEGLAEDVETLRRTGMPAALGIMVHSFPEGLAVFVAALHLPAPMAYGAALALALHNIPEGIATAMPMYHATGSRVAACGFSSLTGLAEPLGALLVYSLCYRFLSDTALGVLTAVGAGVMVFIALDGLLPAARVYGKYHHAIGGVLLGLLVAIGLSML